MADYPGGERMTFTFEQARAYFAYRNPGESIPSRPSFMWRCPFHGDRTESMSVNLDKGGLWTCHACNIGGGLYEYEKQMFPGRSSEEHWQQIYKATGAKPDASGKKAFDRGPVVATYRYEDEDGKLLFEKQRHQPKSFTQRAPDGKGWRYSLEGVRKVLYRLPRIITAQVVFITEGEKDADAIAALELTFNDRSIIATCNFDGAGKWRDEYGPYLAGKRVVIFPDNDDAGRAHAKTVAASAIKFARSVKVVMLPDLPEKGDISDYLQTHTKEDLLKAVKEASPFREVTAAPAESPFFVAPSRILPEGTAAVDWLVPGVIHRGGKGIIVAPPKAGKSMLALDLAVALTHRLPWLGIPVQEARRVALVSREDGPGMTMARIKEFAAGRSLNFNQMDGPFVNTHQQRSSFGVDNEADVVDLCKWLKFDRVELVIFDVLNRLHGAANENDAMEMTRVMGCFDRIRLETGCDVVVIHHDAKNSAAGGQRKPRGSSAIDSWWDWKVSITVDEQDDARKQVFFATKAGQAAPPVTVAFQANNLTKAMRIVPLEGR